MKTKVIQNGIIVSSMIDFSPLADLLVSCWNILLAWVPTFVLLSTFMPEY